MKKIILLLILFAKFNFGYAQFSINSHLSLFPNHIKTTIGFDNNELCDVVKVKVTLGGVLNGVPKYTHGDSYYEVQIKSTGKGSEIIKSTTYTPNNQGNIGVLNPQTNQTELNFISGISNYPRVAVDIIIKEYVYNNDPGFSKYILRQIYKRNQGLTVCGYEEDNDDVVIGTSDYDLQLLESDVFVNSLCSDCADILERLNSGFFGGPYPENRHRMTIEGSSVNTTLTIKNLGNTSSAATKVKFYLSDSYNDTSGVIANIKTINLPNLEPGEEFVTNPSFTIYDFNRSPGNYYIVIHVEEGNNDSNASNNVVNIPVEVNSANDKNKNLRLNLGNTTIHIAYTGIINQPDHLRVYHNSSSSPIIDTQINRNRDGRIINMTNYSNGVYFVNINNKVIKRVYKQ